jgi:hypothetical protein
LTEGERKVREAIEALARFRDPDFAGEPSLAELTQPLLVLDSVKPRFLGEVLAGLDPMVTARCLCFVVGALAVEPHYVVPG